MMTASYTLGDAKSVIGTSVDELGSNNLQEAELLYDDPRVFGPTTRDSRHSGTLTAVWQAKGFTIAPIYIFRSPTAGCDVRGVDFNRNGENNDLTERAFAFTGLNDDGTATFEDIGACETWNCSRAAWRSQMNLRVSYGFPLFGNSRLEAIGEVFNLFNAKNPGTFIANSVGLDRTSCSRPSSRATSRTPSSGLGRSGSGSRSSSIRFDQVRGGSRRFSGPLELFMGGPGAVTSRRRRVRASQVGRCRSPRGRLRQLVPVDRSVDTRRPD